MLLIGPPGSGKSRRIMEAVRDRLRKRDFGFRLLVPTATMAEHLRHSLAREGFVFRPELISTLTGFVNTLEPGLQPLSAVRLRTLIRTSLNRLRLRVLEASGETRGLISALASTMEEVAAAGVDPGRLRSALETSRDAIPRAFAELYADVTAEAEAGGFGFRNRRLGLAAARLRELGAWDSDEFFLDGFFSLTDPELGFLEALGARASLTVALPDWPGARPAWLRLSLMGLREERLGACHRQPEVQVVEAETQEREAGEVALRILELARLGVRFREMGIIVRQHDPYVPLLISTLSRCGIPVRAYFSSRLADHPVVQYYRALVAAALSGWDHERTLAALNLSSSGLPGFAEYRRFAYNVRERLPDAGLVKLKAFSPGGVVATKLDKLPELESWRAAMATPGEWAKQLSSLRELVAFPDPAAQHGFEDALSFRQMAAACEAFEACLNETASVMPPSPIDLSTFWEEVEQALYATALPPADRRRNVVHLLEVHEARQWELPVVFVCGLLERQFPLHHAQNPFLTDEIRRTLQREGFRLATAEERDQEEEFLFLFAVTRATRSLVLSYPRFNSNGDPTLRSFLLERYLEENAAIPVACARAVRPAPTGGRAPEIRPRIAAEDLRQSIAPVQVRTTATAVVTFLECPFQFFAGHTLRLEEPPVRPEERLDALLQGGIVHEVLERCLHDPGRFESVFEEVFSRHCAMGRVPAGYRTEAVRLALARDLKRFVRVMRLEGAEPERAEEEHSLVLDEGVTLKCKLDRIDRLADGSKLVIDYKYSAKSSVEKFLQEFQRESGQVVHIQAGVYMAALEQAGQSCGGFLFAAIRDGEAWAGWSASGNKAKGIRTSSREQLSEIMRRSLEAATEAVKRLREGVIAPDPADPDHCQNCAYRLICRIESAAKTVAAGGLLQE